jgi:hyaluronoglucosaminidase
VTPRSSAAGYGVVEGFYGRPWSRAARARIVEDLAVTGLDTYLWAPKDEPSHRARWAEPLSAAALAEVEHLSGTCRSRGIELVHGIAPVGSTGRGFRWLPRYRIEESAREALRRRVRDVAGAGVRGFAVLFDDTLPTFVPQAASRTLGEVHGTIARIALDAAPAGARALVVPAVYYRRAHAVGPGGLAYLRGIASVVGRDIPVAWTGPRIFSPWIAGRDIAELEEATGLSIFVWNNAIANDWLPLLTGAFGARRRMERLSSGPVMNLAPDALARASGVLLNGAREAELTRVALRTFADFLREPSTYDPLASWARAVEDVFEEAAPPVRELLDRVRGHPLCAPHVRDWRVRELVQAARRGEATATRLLIAEAERLSTLEARLADALHGHPAWPEIQPTAAAVRAGALRLRAAASGQVSGPPSSGPWATDLDGSVSLLLARRTR